MNEDFVSFELAIKLKEKGLDEPFYFYYRTDDKLIHHAMVTKPLVYCDKIDDEVVCAPTIPQVLKWLREEKKIHIGIIFTGKDYTAWIQPLNTDESQITMHECSSDTKAELASIEYVLDNLI